MPCSPLACHVRQTPPISGIKHPKSQNSSPARRGKERSCVKCHNFCPQCFVPGGGFAPARGVSAVSDGSGLCSPSPRSRAGLAVSWRPGAVLASGVASTACHLELCGRSCGLCCSCSLPAWWCPAFRVQLGAHGAPRQDVCGEP